MGIGEILELAGEAVGEIIKLVSIWTAGNAEQKADAQAKMVAARAAARGDRLAAEADHAAGVADVEAAIKEAAEKQQSHDKPAMSVNPDRVLVTDFPKPEGD